LKKIIGLSIGLLVSVFILAGGSAVGQEKAKAPQAVLKKLIENDKVVVIETRYAPGAENSSVPRDARVVRALTTGTLVRSYPDGKTEKVEWKAGEAKYFPALAGAVPQYTTKNVGKTELVLYLVVLK
jgi:hypothetical protein